MEVGQVETQKESSKLYRIVSYRAASCLRGGGAEGGRQRGSASHMGCKNAKMTDDEVSAAECTCACACAIGRVRASAGECGRVRASAGECGRVRASAGECGRVRESGACAPACGSCGTARCDHCAGPHGPFPTEKAKAGDGRFQRNLLVGLLGYLQVSPMDDKYISSNIVCNFFYIAQSPSFPLPLHLQ